MEDDKRRKKNKKKKNKQSKNVENGVAGAGEAATTDQDLVNSGSSKDEHTHLSDTATADELSTIVDLNEVRETETGDQSLINNDKHEPAHLTADEQMTNVDWNGVQNLVKDEHVRPLESADGQSTKRDSNGHLPNGKECAISEETIRKLKEENDMHIHKVAISEETIRKLKEENDIHIHKEAISEETIRKLKEANDMHIQKEAILEETIRKLKEENDMHMQKEVASEETIRKLKEEHEMYAQKEAISDETIRKLNKQNDVHFQKEATLEETINKLQTENELQMQKQAGLEMRIAQLQSENNSLLQKEAVLVEKTNQLLNEKEVLSLKEESLERKINLLESDLSSSVEKENLAKEIISNLNGNVSMLQVQVAELEESRNNLFIENQQLRENVSGLQTKVQNLENNSSSSSSLDASAKDRASENEDSKSQIEAACMLVEKLVVENAELVEKVNELYIELERRRAEVELSRVTGLYGMTEFAKPASAAVAVPESAEITSVSAQELDSLEEASVKDNGDSTNAKHTVGLVSNSSLVSDDAGEIVQIPLDDNEVRDPELQHANNQEQDAVPLRDAPLIGAPFRLVSFVAKYVSGADLVNQSSSNTSR